MFPESSSLVSPSEWAAGNPPALVAVDYETYYTGEYSIATMGAWAYCQDPRFDAYLVAVTDGLRTCVCPPADFPWQTIASATWVSHNAAFDSAVHSRLRFQPPGRWHCTADLCAFLQYPRALDKAMQAVFGATISKDVRAGMRGKDAGYDLLGFADDVIRYAATDAEACLALWARLSDQWPAHERQLSWLTADMGTRGVAMDWAYVERKIHDLRDTLDALKQALPWEPALSIPKFQEACEATGIAPPKSTGKDDPKLAQWIRANVDSDPALWVRHMQRIRSANRTAKVLESMQARCMPDGRMAYELKYCGASPGRWSGSGGLNLQNLNRKSSESVDLRKAIIAPRGKKLAIVDYSQIEARVLLFLAGDTKTLSMMSSNPDLDIYEVHARATMKYAEPEPLKVYCDRTGNNLRNLAKARVLGLGFGCGAKRFIEVAKIMAGLDIDFHESDRIVNEYRASNPKVVELWRRLNDSCAACEGGDYALPFPCTQANPAHGRYLFYRGIETDDEGIVCTVGKDRVRVYGGLICENWTQGTARDVLASAWLRCARAGFTPVLSVHDELVFEVSGDSDLSEIVSIMETPIPWAPGLPLATEGFLTDHYTK